MKKLLVFVLVLGMASLANAAIVGDLELRIGGNAVDEYDVGVLPADITDISITNNEAISSGGLEGYFILISETGNAFDINSAVILNTDLFLDATGLDELEVPHPTGMDGVFGGVFNYGTTYAVDTVLFDDIKLTVNGSTLSIYEININEAEAWVLGDMMDEINIIPEPMTITLLGLGGLLIRRK